MGLPEKNTRLPQSSKDIFCWNTIKCSLTALTQRLTGWMSSILHWILINPFIFFYGFPLNPFQVFLIPIKYNVQSQSARGSD